VQHWPDNLSGLKSAEIADGKLFLILNNTLAAVDDGRQEILRFLGPVDAMPLNRLETIFEEMVSNIVRHGFERNSGQSIHVRVEHMANAIKLTFEDDGTPYNLLDAALPARATSIETATIGGLGIPLIVKLSSTLSYEALSPAETLAFRPRNRTIVTVAA
jgi:anti-sigma regulatory factor (Ser/Thr protein kinase)